MDTQAQQNRIKGALDDYNVAHHDAPITVKELAERTLQTERSVYRHLTNATQPSIVIAARYAAVLGASIEDLIEVE